ncbi:MAG: ribosomal-processing cysteine protease Prp [Peptococcaceae bacterium]|nr:ribosomal-processing cysteine protease Prp [Peptococcaceae bacterium]
MVKVITYLDERSEIRAFQVEGHAGFARAGEDIVCAAISALTISAVNGLEAYLSEKPDSDETDGKLVCRLPGELAPESQLIAKVILGTMLLGLKEIRSSYGSRYISFEQRRWTPC